MTHLDTSYLVDLLREVARGDLDGPAHTALDTLADETLAVSVHVACELYAGAALSGNSTDERARVGALLAALDVVPTGEGFPARYGELLAELRKRGQTVATMDLLIATAALDQKATLVTRNASDFDRIPGLMVRAY